ncbi:MAG: DNA cytosine methyltransferase, partial [Nocardioidaceae bacterium]
MPIRDVSDAPVLVAEFFSGIGLMAQGLEPWGFRVAWANDIEPAKRDLYLANRPGALSVFHLGDVRSVLGRSLPDG